MNEFIDACLRKDTGFTPVWFMRQAGRYLPSYRALKGSKSVIEIAKDPQLASEAVSRTVNELGVDAGIIFADIMLPLEGMGVEFRIEENVGPVVFKPVRTASDVESLTSFDGTVHALEVYDSIVETVRKLDGVPLIGFCGAPFTLAGYLVEGSPSRDMQSTREMMYGNPEAWSGLMEKLTSMAIEYLRMQIKYGVAAVQLFDSWVGCLSREDYSRYVAPYTARIFTSLKGLAPTIHFCANSSHLIEEFCSTGPDVLSVDWRPNLGDVFRRSRGSVGVQGNLDPVAPVVGGAALERGVEEVLSESEGHRGHIFSLGHGVLKETPPENLKAVVRMVHERSSRRK